MNTTIAPTDRATAVVSTHVDRLDPITLDELDELAALQTRVDRKYVLTPDEVHELLSAVARQPVAARVLEIGGARTFTYDSTYFDTPELTTFHQAARRRRRRFKVRTRTYVDTGGTFLEVKTRAARGVTVKVRRPTDPELRTLQADDHDFVDDRLAAARVAAPPSSDLVPVLSSRYRRTTLLLPDVRMTLDTSLAWRLAPGYDGGTHHADVGDLVVVETKAGTAPSSVDRLLWRSGHRPDRISKYATGLTVLRPDLPDHPWRRLRRERLAA
ncbi:polyphosphate polymerase domain-containing protein [Isoptericola halotolerans]|uniref:polyphosphate polymerase domain-containing protein n=1 Tax=Isoptericola halotolerans TaxID=300560 RepID=UPI00388DBB52